MKRYINMVLIATVVGIAAIVACNKKLNVTDQNNPTPATYFKTASELQNGVDAAYSSIRGGNLVGREWFFTHDMRGSETSPGGAQLEPARAELLKSSSPSSSNSVMTSVWNGTYQIINRANLVITNAPGVTDNAALRDETVAEAKFFRAWAYFELVSMWGPVPMYLEPVISPSGYKTQSPVADVYAQVIKDLTDAAAGLPAVASQKGRVTSGAANAMLGRVQMQNGDYASAKTALLAVVNSNQYALVDSFQDNFDGDVIELNPPVTHGPGSTTEFNKESVWEVVFVDKGDNNFNWGYTGEGPTADASIMRSQEYGIVWGNVVPSDAILDEFEPGDPRYHYTFYESGDSVNTQKHTHVGTVLTEAIMNVAPSNHNGVVQRRVYRKGSILDWTTDLVKDNFHPDGINQRMIRYADVLLMLAECEAEVGTPGAAAGYINQVRARKSVNMPPVVLATKTDALKAVMHERAVELAGEEVNNIDMLRWRAKGYYPSIRPDPKPGQVAFFPIPAAESSTNPLIK
jgi:starch-binding outer membrane protein, SusD/RagB family